ncbi:MAG: DUF898 domain-containing protein [Candidatus Accumulibacter sp.]|jgi:uncharacterized membrane protein YjgN (DUF898 family)|nr:DUF898 domain-containing protein [Accumulibacter sp.]
MNDGANFPDDLSGEDMGEAFPEEPVEYGFEFTGSGHEYFRIWILDLAFNIGTLGMYSPWAKVHRKRYFHRNTFLDGYGFDYHGDPISILRGRLVVCGLFFALLVFCVLALPAPPLFPVALVVVFLPVPWLLVRSLGFHARNTSYRGLRFEFHGAYRECASLVLLGFLLFIAMVIFFPKLWELLAPIVQAWPVPTTWTKLALLLIVVVPAYALLFHAFKHFEIDRLSFGRSHFACATRWYDFYPIFLSTVLAVFVFFVFHLFYLRITAFLSVEWPAWSKGSESFFPYETILIFLFLVFLAAIRAYFQSRVANCVRNGTMLGGCRLVSTQRFKGLFALTLSNWLLASITLGLYWPWGKVKLAAYRARHTSLIAKGRLTDLVDGGREEACATGKEVPESFDYDIAL